MEHALFVTALTQNAKGPIHYSCTLYTKLIAVLLDYPKPLAESHSRSSTSLGVTGAAAAVPGGASVTRLGLMSVVWVLPCGWKMLGGE